MNKVDLLSTEKQEFNSKTAICPLCGKEFFVQNRSSYIYKVRNKNSYTRYLCSWPCFNKAKEKVKVSSKTK